MLYFLSLGSNLGMREQTIRDALRLIRQQIGLVTRYSSFYYSKPWGYESPNEFCNLCCAVESTKEPLEVLLLTQTIERVLGRQKKTSDSLYSDRTIDIDLIKAFDGNGKEIKYKTPALVLPHPLWQQRDFVCVPLREIESESFQLFYAPASQ